MRTFLVFLFLAAAALAQRAMTVAEVVGFVKSQVKFKADDRLTGDFLRKIKLTQKLDAKTIEELQGQGAGPKTVAALRKLEEESAGLAPPPPPVAVQRTIIPAPDSIEQADVLGAMKEYALHYTAKLPNYLCTQITRRHLDPKDPKYRAAGDVIQE